MAEKKTNTLESYKQLITKLKQGQISPVYLLMGEESYYIDKISKWLYSNLLKDEEKDFNLSILYGADVTAKQIMDKARRFPMMSERQVIVVREAQSIKGIDELERYMDKPVSTTVLVLCYKGGVID